MRNANSLHISTSSTSMSIMRKVPSKPVSKCFNFEKLLSLGSTFSVWDTEWFGSASFEILSQRLAQSYGGKNREWVHGSVDSTTSYVLNWCASYVAQGASIRFRDLDSVLEIIGAGSIPAGDRKYQSRKQKVLEVLYEILRFLATTLEGAFTLCVFCPFNSPSLW